MNLLRYKRLRKFLKSFKEPYLTIRNFFRIDIKEIYPFIKAEVILVGIKLKFLTHKLDKIHGGMIRGDNRRDQLAHGELRYLASIVKPNMKVLDVGANLGSVSITLAKYQPSIKVYCFEPEPKNFGMLVVNIEMNNITNIVPFNAAVGTNEGYINMYLNKNNFGDHRSFEPIKKMEAKEIHSKQKIPISLVNPVRFLNESLLDEAPQNFDIIKIDTQGADFDALRSALPMCKSGTTVVIEFSPFHLSEFGESWETIECVLKNFSQVRLINSEVEKKLSRQVSIQELSKFFNENCAEYKGYLDLSLIH